MSIFQGHETVSNHGTSQGIIPRFFLQTLELAKMALGKEKGENKIGDFLTKNIPDFTNLYDLHQIIQSEYNDFKAGLNDERYFSINAEGQYRLDRSVEIQLEKKIKDFFILGRLLINNFAKSGLIDTEHFVFLIIVSDKNFEKNMVEYFKNDPAKKFEDLFNIIEQSRKLFLNEFNQIRADIEHQNLSIPKFKVDKATGKITEPSLKGIYPLDKEITLYYNYLFSFIEVLIGFYFGIEAYEKSPILGLFERDEYDYSKMIYRYNILPRMEMQGMKIVY